MARASWEGVLRLNLISVPVKAFTTTSSNRGKIGFHLIHAACGNRIRYQKVCPVHGEVSNDEIVPGYEQSRGEYTLVDRKQLDKLKPDADKTITLDLFVGSNAIDPMYFGDKSYYLTPDGRIALNPYAVLQKVMAEEERWGVGMMVFSGREQLVLLRPLGKLLVAHLLNYEEQVKKPATFEEEVPASHVSGKEMELARKLIEASTPKEFELGHYRDEYTSKLLALLQSKGAKAKGSHSDKHEGPAVINLMDALRKSLDKAGKTAPNTRTRPSKKRAGARRKTG